MPLSKFGIVLLIFGIINIYLCGYAAQDAANSTRNKTQIERHELTARDQGNSKVDIEITRNIRRRVVSEKSFSGSAKNIKIITIGGAVTLKGPVQSQDEKEAIDKIAHEVAGRAQVNNELEVINQ